MSDYENALEIAGALIEVSKSIDAIPVVELRDRFAMAALTGMLADGAEADMDTPFAGAAEAAYLYAEAMLAAREKAGQP